MLTLTVLRTEPKTLVGKSVCIRVDQKTEEYDVVFASYYDEVAAKLSQLINEKDWELYIVIPKDDPLVEQMLIGRMTLRDTGNRYNRWVHRQIRQFSSLSDVERIKSFAPNAIIYQIDYDHPYIMSLPLYKSLALQEDDVKIVFNSN